MIHEVGRVLGVGEVAVAILLGAALLAGTRMALWLLDRVVIERVRVRRIKRLDVGVPVEVERMVADTNTVMGEVKGLLVPVAAAARRVADAVVDVEAFERAAARDDERAREAAGHGTRS